MEDALNLLKEAIQNVLDEWLSFAKTKTTIEKLLNQYWDATERDTEFTTELYFTLKKTDAMDIRDKVKPLLNKSFND